MTSRRHDAETRGRRAEALAALYLRLKGYRILDRRVRTPLGEIDLVARRGEVLAIIEVKARSTLAEGLIAVSRRQQGRLLNALQFYLMRNPHLHDLALRFDVMIVRPLRLPLHITGAFIHDRMPSLQRRISL